MLSSDQGSSLRSRTAQVCIAALPDGEIKIIKAPRLCCLEKLHNAVEDCLLTNAEDMHHTNMNDARSLLTVAGPESVRHHRNVLRVCVFVRGSGSGHIEEAFRTAHCDRKYCRPLCYHHLQSEKLRVF